MISLLVRIIGHSIGVGVVFSATFWVHRTSNVGTLMAEGWANGLAETVRLDLALQLLLAMVLWGIVVLCFAQFNALLRQRKKVTRIVVSNRGTVLTETLIALPVALLLIFGLCQLTLNNTAAIMTSLSAFQASRAVYLWHPETESGWARNGGVSKSQVEEKARIAAVSVLAPVAASDYLGGQCATSSEFDAKVEAMMSTTLGGATGGIASMTGVRALAAGRALPFESEKSMAKAYDSDMFAIRGPIKMLFAYCNTTVNYQSNGTVNRTSVAYSHRATMPLVARIFGEVRPTGIYSTIERSYEMPVQLHPNPAPPTSIFALLNFNPFSSWN